MVRPASAITIDMRIVNNSAASPPTLRTRTANTSTARPSAGLALLSGWIPDRYANQSATGARSRPCPASGSVHQSRKSRYIGWAKRTANATAVATMGARSAGVRPSNIERARILIGDGAIGVRVADTLVYEGERVRQSVRMVSAVPHVPAAAHPIHGRDDDRALDRQRPGELRGKTAPELRDEREKHGH